MRKFRYNIDIECEENVSEKEILQFQENIMGRLHGYTTESPNYLGKFKMFLKIDYDKIGFDKKDYEKKLKDKGRYMSLLLRHSPEKESLNIDDQGYVLVTELVDKLKISEDDLHWIVDNNDKSRFKFNSDETMIRAAQGHSIKVDLKMKRILPPDVLYHGTSIANNMNISKGGLKKMNRNNVHMTDDRTTAYNVGMRYAKYENKIWIIEIDAKRMNADGFEFFKSENGVYLIEHVPQKYFL